MVKTKTPNIIFILADDLDMNVFNQDEKLPGLLTRKGTIFMNHFAPLSLCCPSRVSTLRGQFPHNTTIYTNTPESGGGFQGTFHKGLEESTIATWLHAAGYRTALLGKYLNGYPLEAPSVTYIPPGWDYWVSPNGGHPQSQYNYSLNDNGTTIHYGQAPNDYFGDVLKEKTLAFIKDSVNNHSDQPFFAYVSSHAPHKPATPPPRYEHRYPNDKAPRTASFNEKDVSDKPLWVRSLGPLSARQIEDVDNLFQKRRESLLALSDLVEELIETLTEIGVLENTYIFFTSDNGFHQGQHTLNSGKTTAYEEDIKIPLVVRGPGVPEGNIVQAITANVDYAPTFAEIADIIPPSFVDGRSLLPFLRGETPQIWRQALILEFGGPASINRASANPLLEVQDPFDIDLLSDGKPLIPAFAGLRIEANPLTKGGLTYVEYSSGERELYDLSQDPNQLNNYYPSADKALTSKLAQWLNSLRHASGQELREREQDSW